MEILILLALVAIWLFDKYDKAQRKAKAEQTASSSGRPASSFAPLSVLERASCIETHRFEGSEMHCADCGWSVGAIRKAGRPCSFDRSPFAEQLRRGGWGQQGEAAFREAHQQYRQHDRKHRTAGRSGTRSEPRFDPREPSRDRGTGDARSNARREHHESNDKAYTTNESGRPWFEIKGHYATHRYAGRGMACLDCGLATTAIVDTWWPCASDWSPFAEKLREGGWWGADEEAEFEQDLADYMESREMERPNRWGSEWTGESQGSGGDRRRRTDGNERRRSTGERRSATGSEAEALSVLELEPGATASEIKKAWRDLCRVWHPDRFGHDERMRVKATAKLATINNAYDVLRGGR